MNRNIRRALLAALAAASAVAALQPAAGAAPPEGKVVEARQHWAEGWYNVRLHDAAGASAESIQSKAESLLAQYGGTVQSTWSRTLQGFSVRGLSEGAARRLAANPAVKAVYETGTARGADVQDNAPWTVDRVDQADLPLNTKYEYTATGEGVTVYNMDSGTRVSHSEFEGRARDGYDFFDKDAVAQDCHGHGTHTASMSVGKTYGVAKKAKLVALRVFDCSNSGPDALVIDAVEWIDANGQKPAVVNMSLGQYEAGIGDEQIRSSIQKGFIYVFAAGNNNGAAACNYSPARVTEGLTVASTEKNDSRSGFSNIGTCVDLFAPGGSNTGAAYSSDTATRQDQGTSFSAPLVTGAAALYLQSHPTANQAEVNKAIIDSATAGKVTNAGTGSPNKLLYTKGVTGGPGPGPTCAKQTNDTDVSIPDAGSAVVSTITVSGCTGSGSSAAQVEVAVAHSYRGDLVVELVAPDGSAYRLKESSAADHVDDVRATYTVNLSSETKNGDWKLRVQDVYRYDTGTIQSWSLTV
ncbi:Serine protease, subtilisin family [Actinokineospora alba]|uniref:Serine protease, subtilisin family n=1 Tax=Actinokineospora alba TaxID=504798 RepID=A0A1H0LXL1_9PSEU|nr:S8 family serine peptidase [Actinokineospora alba]TDP67492.1 subtilisin family serine protease [Actinokineospora alba]SDI47064.1 Serine protease, subtilisin family [Actinokineospora alba]SDO72736.1 Serine protease, subtilisin family [Actinokineospora alba]